MSAVLASLSPRDRKLLAGLVLFFAVVGGGLLLFLAKGDLDAKAAQLRSAKDTMEVMVAMEEMYQEASTKLAASESHLKEARGVRLDAHVEKIAAQTGVSDQLRSVDEQGSEMEGNLKSTRYRVELRKVPLSQALDFLYDLEVSDYPVSVDRAQFKTIKVDNETMINLTLDLVTLTLKDGV
ncbi:MAG: type II secretion system protein M [Deltaproteobacteria bacterium]|nr:type II secretion system protein M [Deltaproteobacteria bacterium]